MEPVELNEYPGYLIYPDGRVFIRRAGRFVKPTVNANGYYRITIKRADGSWRNEYVHRLVALAYVPLVDGRVIIDHINGDRLDNRAENLRWCTTGENVTYPGARANLHNWLQSDKGRESIQRRAVEHSRPILCVDTGIAFHGVTECERAMNINNSDICHAIAVRGRTSGYTFQYLTKEEYADWPADRKDKVLAGVGRPSQIHGKGRPVWSPTLQKVYTSAKEAADDNGTTVQMVARCARGERSKAKGVVYTFISWDRYTQLKKELEEVK